MKKRFLSGSEIWLFQGAKTLEIASKLFSSSDKAISFWFGKFTFYVRQNTRNRVKVVLSSWKRFLSDSEKPLFQSVIHTENYFKVALTQRKREFIRFQKIHFLRTWNAENCWSLLRRHGKRFVSDSENSLLKGQKSVKSRRSWFGSP